MTIAIGTDRTAVGGPPPKGVVVAVDNHGVWYFFLRFGGEDEIIIPVSRQDAISRLAVLATDPDFDSVEAHAQAMARTFNMDARVLTTEELSELKELIADGFIMPCNGVMEIDREAVRDIAEAVGNLAA
jgi:hypothetical protein